MLSIPPFHPKNINDSKRANPKFCKNSNNGRAMRAPTTLRKKSNCIIVLLSP